MAIETFHVADNLHTMEENRIFKDRFPILGNETKLSSQKCVHVLRLNINHLKNFILRRN